jgi:hypothetical protein
MVISSGNMEIVGGEIVRNVSTDDTGEASLQMLSVEGSFLC